MSPDHPVRPAHHRYASQATTVHAGYASTRGMVGVILLTFITGTLYIPLQWYRHGVIEDAVFVSMLIAATMILMIGLRQLQKYIVTRGLDFYSFVFSTTDPGQAVSEHARLCRTVIHFRNMTIVGILYGMGVGSAPFLLGVWKYDIVLRIALSVFMVCANFATGVAFYGLLTFFYHAIRMGRMVKVDLWRVDNPSTNFLLGATRRLSILASAYICICLSSIMFSVLPVSGLVIAYSVFSALVILASLIVPSLPVAQKLREAKAETLRQIDEQIQEAFARTLAKMDDQVDMSRFDSLLQLREKVAGVDTLPFKLKAVGAGASVLMLSSIPVLLQELLKRLFS